MPPPRPILALAFALALGATVLAAPPARADATHVVGKGQTLVWIAKRYRTTPEAIRAANNLREKQLIHPGLALTIPGAPGKDDASKPKGKEDKAKDAKAKGKEKEPEAPRGKGKDAKKAKDPTDPKDAKSAKKGKDAKAKDPTPASYAARPKKPGFVTMVRGTEKLTAQVLARGQLNRASLPGLTKILRHVASDSKKAVDPRLAYLIGLVSDHFGGRTIQVVSGYRPYSKKQYTPHSNHNFARAMDFAIEGVPNTVVRDYCRTLRDAGVGYYPNSTFVHLDVRTGKAYWVDYSGPGEAPRYQKGGKGKVDESAADVDSNDTPGSPATQATPKQPPDSKPENPDQSTPKPPSRPTPGLKTPTPPKPDSPTPPVGKSDDPY